jgi:hypothetical protein
MATVRIMEDGSIECETAPGDDCSGGLVTARPTFIEKDGALHLEIQFKTRSGDPVTSAALRDIAFKVIAGETLATHDGASVKPLERPSWWKTPTPHHVALVNPLKRYWKQNSPLS